MFYFNLIFLLEPEENKATHNKIEKEIESKKKPNHREMEKKTRVNCK